MKTISSKALDAMLADVFERGVRSSPSRPAPADQPHNAATQRVIDWLAGTGTTPAFNYATLSTVQALAARVERLEADQTVRVHVETFAPEPYRLLRPIPVVIRPSGDGFVAAFHDANIHASGDTDQEAFENLRSMVLDAFEMLTEHADALGPAPARQLAILREFICDHSSEKTANALPRS